MKIQISNDIKERWNDIALGVLIYRAEVVESPSELIELFMKSIDGIKDKYELSDIADLTHIQSTRNAYKALGKSPSEYRNASEAMLRRIVKGNGLYEVNNIIEINNLISVTTGYSIGSYDTDMIIGPIELRRAPDGEKYQGIGKEAVNIEHIPTLYDGQGAFGNPTSDSRRAMVQTGEHNIMSVIYSFDGGSYLQEIMNRYCELLREYCSVDEIDTVVII